jgi:hypothetical protein
MKRVYPACLALPMVAIVAPAALATPMFVSSVGQPGDALAFTSSDVLEARFRADTTNWNLRLENNGSPASGDNQLNMANGRGFYEGNSFDFVLSYSASLDRFEWALSRNMGKVSSLVFDADEFESFNTIQFSSSGSRADVTVSDLAFSGLGMTETAWPGLSSSPSGTSFAQTNLFFGNSANLLSDDWQLSGRVGFDNFTQSNPGEGAKITARLYQTAEIPSPSGMAGLMLAAGFCLARRRRA